MKKDSLGDRMKDYYEDRAKTYLTRRTPVIMRLDGKAFHTFTRGCTKPFDEKLSTCMVDTTRFLMQNIQGAKLGYTQSDEISLLITDFDKLETEAWFNYNVQKMCSVSAAMASVQFTLKFADIETHLCDVDHAYFDSRVFNIPKEDVNNYFVWRQKDWRRNSVAMMAQSLYSAKELHKQGKADQLEMIQKKGQDWNALSDKWKNGTTLLNTKDGIFEMPELEFQGHSSITGCYLYDESE